MINLFEDACSGNSVLFISGRDIMTRMILEVTSQDD